MKTLITHNLINRLKHRLVEFANSDEFDDWRDGWRMGTWQPHINEHHHFRYKKWWYDDFGIEHSLLAYSEPLFGFEIELEAGKAGDNYMKRDWRLARKMSRIVSRNRYLSCHYDGSIAGAGFEVRSEPATLGFFMDRFDWSYLRKLERLDARTVGIGERGFHIHVDKRAFVDEAHIERFAREVSDDVATWAVRHGWAYVGPYAKLIDDSDPTWKDDKYMVVNVKNVATVEVRCLVPSFDEWRIRDYFRYVSMLINETKEVK